MEHATPTDTAALLAAIDAAAAAYTDHVILTGSDQIYGDTSLLDIRCMNCGFSQYLGNHMAVSEVETLLHQVKREHRHCPPPPESRGRFEKRRRGRGSRPAP